MATRKQVVDALYKISPDAEMVEEDINGNFQVMIEAPEGHHWRHMTHCLTLPEWFNGPRSEYWDMVLDDVKKLVPVKCEDDPCEGVRDFGFCEYWD